MPSATKGGTRSRGTERTKLCAGPPTNRMTIRGPLIMRKLCFRSYQVPKLGKRPGMGNGRWDKPYADRRPAYLGGNSVGNTRVYYPAQYPNEVQGPASPRNRKSPPSKVMDPDQKHPARTNRRNPAPRLSYPTSLKPALRSLGARHAGGGGTRGALNSVVTALVLGAKLCTSSYARRPK